MGASCSTDARLDAPPPPPPAANTLTSSVSASDFSSYLTACESDAQLRDFDSGLRQQTTQLVTSFADGQQVGTLSVESLRALTGCLADTNHEVVRIMLKSNKDAWKSPDLLDLAQQYFDYSDRVLDFLTSLNACLRAAQNRELLIKLALGHFEEESKAVGGADAAGNSLRFAKTLQELRNLKEEGNPFSDEFFASLKSLQILQMQMLNKIKAKRQKLTNKMKSAKIYRRISLVIFAACFVGVIVFSVVAAAIAAPPLVTALAAAISAQMGGMGKWLDSLWSKYQKDLKAQYEEVDTLRLKSLLTLAELQDIGLLATRLEIRITEFLTTAEFSIRDDSILKVVIGDMTNKLSGLTTAISELEERSILYSRDIGRCRTVILQGLSNRGSDSERWWSLRR